METVALSVVKITTAKKIKNLHLIKFAHIKVCPITQVEQKTYYYYNIQCDSNQLPKLNSVFNIDLSAFNIVMQKTTVNINNTPTELTLKYLQLK